MSLIPPIKTNPKTVELARRLSDLHEAYIQECMNVLRMVQRRDSDAERHALDLDKAEHDLGRAGKYLAHCILHDDSHEEMERCLDSAEKLIKGL